MPKGYALSPIFILFYFQTQSQPNMFFMPQRISKRTKMVRELISEVVGLCPYEKRLLDMLKTGGASAEKRMYKFAKRRLGTHTRAVKKRDQVKDVYGKIRARA